MAITHDEFMSIFHALDYMHYPTDLKGREGKWGPATRTKPNAHAEILSKLHEALGFGPIEDCRLPSPSRNGEGCLKEIEG